MMKFLILVWFAMGLSVRAADSSVVALQTVGQVPTNLVVRVAGWVSEQIAPVTNAGPLRLKAKSLDSVALSLTTPAASGTSQHVILVLVAKMEKDSRFSSAMKGVAVVNVGAMQPADLSTEAARETFGRRVEKEAVGGVALAMGMPACPLIYCALYSAQSLEELDQKARGLCPPCMGKLEASRQ